MLGSAEHVSVFLATVALVGALLSDGTVFFSCLALSMVWAALLIWAVAVSDRPWAYPVAAAVFPIGVAAIIWIMGPLAPHLTNWAA